MNTAASESSPAELRTLVLERAHRMTRVPLLPSACQRLLEISHMAVEIVDITELSNIVSHDPSMASRILKVANSPYYSIRQAVSSVRQAILVIGLSDLMSLLLVTSLMEKFNQDEAMDNLSPMDFWIHSVAVGAAARSCASDSSGYMISASEISLAGLLHDIGKSVFIRFFPAESDRCIQLTLDEGCSLLDAETKVFGITHAELGGVLARNWNLPEFIVQVVHFHHHPEEADEAYAKLARMVGWCDGVVLSEGIGKSGNTSPAKGDGTAVDEDSMEAKWNQRRKEILEAVNRDLALIQISSSPDPSEDEAEEEDVESPLPEAQKTAIPLHNDADPPKGFFARIRRFFSGN